MYFLPRSLKNSVFRGVRRWSKTVLFDLVFLTPRQKVSFGPRTQNDDFLGTRPRAAPLGSCQKNSSFFVLGTKLLFRTCRGTKKSCFSTYWDEKATNKVEKQGSTKIVISARGALAPRVFSPARG